MSDNTFNILEDQEISFEISSSGGVESVNGKTGIVTLNATDVGALPNTTVIPTKTSELTNDSGFLTEHQSLSGYATEQWVENKGYLTEHQSLANYSTTSEMNSAINAHHDSTKQDVINDLSDIRSGATLGTTSVQPGDNVSELVNDSGYLTQHQSLSGYATESWVEDQCYLTEHQSIKTVNNNSLVGTGNINVHDVFYVEATSTSFPSNITITTPFATAYSEYQAGKYLVLRVVENNTNVYHLQIQKATPTELFFYSRKSE